MWEAEAVQEDRFTGTAWADDEADSVVFWEYLDRGRVKGGGSVPWVVKLFGQGSGEWVDLDCGGEHGGECRGIRCLRPEKKRKFPGFLTGVGPMMVIGSPRRFRPDMKSTDLFALVDLCIEAGFYPLLAGRRYVLGLQVQPAVRAILHREHECVTLASPCRVWVMRGDLCYLLGDSHALPGDLSSGTRPPWTG